MIRRVVRTVATDKEQDLETEYSTGSTWMDSCKFSSAAFFIDGVGPGDIVEYAAEGLGAIKPCVDLKAMTEGLGVHLSWNVGGVAVEQIETGLQEVGRLLEGKPELISFQELSCGDVGWHTEQIGPAGSYGMNWSGSSRTDTWSLLKRKRSGVWVKLRRLADGVELWCGSAYLSQGATREVHATEIHEFVSVLPATDLPVILGMRTLRYAGQPGKVFHRYLWEASPRVTIHVGGPP